MKDTSTTPEIEVGKPYVARKDGQPLFGGFAVAVVNHEEPFALVELLTRRNIVSRIDTSEVELKAVPEGVLLTHEAAALKEIRRRT